MIFIKAFLLSYVGWAKKQKKPYVTFVGIKKGVGRKKMGIPKTHFMIKPKTKWMIKLLCHLVKYLD